MRLGSARPSDTSQLMLAKEGNHSSAPRTQRTFRLVSSEDKLYLHSLLRVVVNQIERSLSLFRIKGLRDHGLRLQRAALEPLDDFREEMSVEPGPHEGDPSRQPAWSRTVTTWLSVGTVSAKPARKALIAAEETRGSTSAKSSPVEGRTAAKM